MPPSKILVIRFSSLGDVVLTTPVYKNLRSAFPKAQIFSAVKAEYSGALEGNPNIDGILKLGKNESLFHFLSRVRGLKFDVLVDLHDNLRSNFISIFSRIPKKLKVQKNILERRLFVRSKVRSSVLIKHNIDRYVEALRPLIPEARVYPPEIYPTVSVGGQNAPAELKILIIQTAFLGDAVLTTPMFKALKQSIPGSKISLLCTPEIRDVFSGNEFLDEILVMDKKGKDRSLAALWRWGNNLRGKFDVALIPHRSFRSAFLAALAGISKRIGFDKSQGKIFLTDTVAFDWKTHDVDRNMKLLEALGISGLTPAVEIQGGKNDLSQFMKCHGLDETTPWVGMNPGSVWETKRWLPEGFAQVADRLIREKKVQVLLIGSEKDRTAVEAVVANMKETPVNLCGKTDLKTLSALIARSKLFVTNDSGPMHLAGAAQVPVVAIFGPTTRELGFYPYGKNSIMVEVDLACRPCTLHGGHVCPLGHFRCMKEVTPEMVLEACHKLMAAS